MSPCIVLTVAHSIQHVVDDVAVGEPGVVTGVENVLISGGAGNGLELLHAEIVPHGNGEHVCGSVSLS